MRKQHILTAPRSNPIPKHVIIVDTETRQETVAPDTVRHVLEFGWAVYLRRKSNGDWTKGEWLRFETAADYWEWVRTKLSKKDKLYMFAHNWAFDAPVLQTFTILPEMGMELVTAVIDAPPVILKWEYMYSSVEMIDTLNFWAMPLDAIGKQVGLEKLPMPALDAPRSEWDTYCKRDVQVLVRALTEWWAWIQDKGMGGFAPTLASQAFRAYRAGYMESPIYIDDNRQALELSREAYHGGRTEAFTIGKVDGPLYLVDVNSMYPYAMRDTPMPTRHVGNRYRATVDDLRALIEKHCVIARVLVRTDEPVYSIIKDNKLMFPVGTFEVTLTTDEVRHALERDHIIDVDVVAVYRRAVLFRRFVDEFYTARLALSAAGDAVGAWQHKILLNSLYGKFGQRGRTWDVVAQTPDLSVDTWVEHDCETNETHNMRRIGGAVQQEKIEGEAMHSHPAIAAHVTAAARLHLWRLMCIAGPSHYHYCDTDSLLVDRAGYDRLKPHLHDTTLGSLKLEREISSATIYGAKDYEFGSLCKTKGVKKKAVMVAPNVYLQEQWLGLKGLMMRCDLSAPVTKKVTKRLARIYDKGVVGPDGHVTPHHLSAPDWRRTADVERFT